MQYNVYPFNIVSNMIHNTFQHCVAGSGWKLFETKTRLRDNKEFTSEKGMFDKWPKNTIHFQPTSRPVTHKKDVNWYFWVDEGIAKPSPLPTGSGFASFEILAPYLFSAS